MKRSLIAGLWLSLWISEAFALDAAESSIQRYRTLAERASEQGEQVVEGREGWLFFAPELRHLGVGRFWGEAAETASRATPVDARDPMPAIVDFHHALQEKGIQLILVPVPPKAVVEEQGLPGVEERSRERPDPYHQRFYQALRAEGVTVLDLTDAFRSADEAEHGPLYCLQDTHWSGAGCVYAARHIAPKLEPFLGDNDAREFETDWRTVEISGDLWSMLDDDALPREEVRVRVVEGAEPDRDSPVLLIGDSHTLVFHAGGDMHTRRAGLSDQLAAELGLPVDLIGVRGSGATPARINLFRRVRRDPDYWDGKTAVVWVFAAREFTESDGWRVVPIEP